MMSDHYNEWLRDRPTAKTVVWRTVLANPNCSGDDLQQALRKAGRKMSDMAATSLASDLRQALKFLRREGLINERRLQARQRTPTSKLSAQRQAIIDVLNKAKHPLGPNAIAAATKMRSNNIRFLLHEMVKSGDVIRCQHGKYQRVTSPSLRRRSFRPWEFLGD